MEQIKKKRKQLSINLGPYHDEWLAISQYYGFKPSPFAAAVLKNAIDEIKQKTENSSFKFKNITESYLQKRYLELKVRLNSEEAAALEQYAAHIARSKSQALISILRAFVANQPEYTLDETEALIKSNGDLRKLGVNINQIAHRVNMMNLDTFAKQDVEEIKILIKRLNKRDEEIRKFINEHVDRVWALVNAGRHRFSFNQDKEEPCQHQK
ncbi:MAG: plasmid mobilization relaxosome protein MobC [Succinivibrio sp.]|nr:plasmid mobilization relaxosome protein MobC [Succinivibrio sp.]